VLVGPAGFNHVSLNVSYGWCSNSLVLHLCGVLFSLGLWVECSTRRSWSTSVLVGPAGFNHVSPKMLKFRQTWKGYLLGLLWETNLTPQLMMR